MRSHLTVMSGQNLTKQNSALSSNSELKRLHSTRKLLHPLSFTLHNSCHLHELPTHVLVTHSLQLCTVVQLSHVDGELRNQLQDLLRRVPTVECQGLVPDSFNSQGRF